MDDKIDTSQLMITKNNQSLDYDFCLQTFVNTEFDPTNKNSIKVQKVFGPTNRISDCKTSPTFFYLFYFNIRYKF